MPSNNYAFQETRSENMNEYTARGDFKLSDQDSLNGSFNIFKDPAFEPSNSLCSSYVVPKFGCFTNQISTLVNVTYDRILTSSLVNDFRLGFQRLQQPRVQEDNTAIGSTYTGLPRRPLLQPARLPEQPRSAQHRHQRLRHHRRRDQPAPEPLG